MSCWTFNRYYEQIRDRDVHALEVRKKVKQMFWASFGPYKRTTLIPLAGDPESPRRGVSARIIYALYRDQLPNFLRADKIFMYDNAPIHKAHIVRDLLHQLGFYIMVWPPYSPDLNPIENLWSILKREIYRLYPELQTAPDTRETLYRLIYAAREAWENIRPQILVSLSETMPNRVQAIIQADGWYTEY